MSYYIDNVTENEYYELINIWNQSMSATHQFIDKDDITLLRKKTLIDMFDKCDMVCIRTEDNSIVGFLGVNNKMVEMLFVSPLYIHSGIGKRLLKFAVDEMAANQLYVFQENTRAVKFYEEFGFKIAEELPVDPITNKPNSLFKMTL
ncbi:MAG: GNAT family N-acetyltransferase [Bacteroidales bacterium]|jgi:putative acetyltransferase|nr:GNAT family N-acetyltransferase [Bacteroidales bacterium]